MQATLNNMKTKALQEWLGQMRSAKYLLERSETNFDVHDASIHTSMAKKFIQIFDIGNGYDPENLHYWLRASTNRLDLALQIIYLGNQIGVITSRNLDQYILQKIENITQTIENIENAMITSTNGVDPVKQLEEKGSLTKIVNYCKQISETYIEIATYY